MPMLMGADLDLAGFFLLNAKPEAVASLPSSADEGRIVFLTADGRLHLRTGGAWHPIGVDVAALEGVTPAQLRDRSTHTGTQTAATISDLDTTVQAYRLDQFAAPTAAVSMGSQRVTNVANGTGANDAVNKAQLDAVSAIANSAASGIAIKAPVRLSTTTNDSLSGLAARDGVTPVAGDRVLVAGQTTASANGIYVAASGAWSRATDADTTGELAPGTLVAVREGTARADTLWSLVSDAAVTIGTTAQTWSLILSGAAGGSEIITAGSGLTKTGSTLSVLLSANSGLVVDGAGLRIDTAVVTRKASGAVSAGAPPRGVTHNLNTLDVSATVIRSSDGQVVAVPWRATGANTLEFDFGATVPASTYRYVVTG